MNEEVFDCVYNWWTGFAGKETCEAGYLDCKEEDCPMYQKVKKDELDATQETERRNNGSL